MLCAPPTHDPHAVEIRDVTKRFGSLAGVDRRSLASTVKELRRWVTEA